MLAALTPEEQQDLIMSVGVHKKSRRLSPCQVSRLLRKASTQQSLQDVALDVDLRDDTVLRKFMSLERLPPEIQALVSWGTQPGSISFSVAAEIARVDSIVEIGQLAAAAVEHRLSKEETRSVIQRQRRAGISLDQALGEILKLRPIVERQHIFLGFLSEDVDEELARRSIRRNLASLVGAQNVLAVKCRSQKFSIVLTSEGATSDQVRESLAPDHLQTFVNSLAKE